MPPSLSAKGTEFLSFFQQLFADNRLLQRCAGASEEDIQALLAYTDRTLPALYLDYLQTLGGNDGPLRLALDGDCSAKSVLRYLRNQGDKWREYQPDNAFRISTDGSIAAHSLLYEDDKAEPNVVIHEGERITSVIAESFDTYLFRHAWQRRWFGKDGNPSSPDLNVRVAGMRSLSGAEQVAQERGFSRQWFSDRWVLCGEKDSIRLITLFSSIDLYLYFSSPDRDAVTRECIAFREALGSHSIMN